jgi:hypothetical protein
MVVHMIDFLVDTFLRTWPPGICVIDQLAARLREEMPGIKSGIERSENGRWADLRSAHRF